MVNIHEIENTFNIVDSVGNLVRLASVDEKLFAIMSDGRGKREKFWIHEVDEKTNQIIEGGKYSFLFKFCRNDVSCENYGEVLFSELAKQVGLDCVQYDLTKFTALDGSTATGVVSQNYKPEKSMLELSGRTITKNFLAKKYDNDFGQIPEYQLNTVEHYCKALKFLYGDDVDITNFRNSLYCKSLLDVICKQTDRHWHNVADLISIDGVHKPAPAYDNGNVFYCNRSYKKLLQYAEQFVRSRNIKAVMVDYERSTMPMLGIKTSLCQTIPCASGDQSLTSNRNTDSLDSFWSELAEVILDNEVVGIFFDSICHNLDIDAAIKSVFRKNPELNEQERMIVLSIGEVAKIVSKYYINKIEHSIVNVAEKRGNDTETEGESY